MAERAAGAAREPQRGEAILIDARASSARAAAGREPAVTGVDPCAAEADIHDTVTEALEAAR
jgi:hypothetical protein